MTHSEGEFDGDCIAASRRLTGSLGSRIWSLWLGPVSAALCRINGGTQ